MMATAKKPRASEPASGAPDWLAEKTGQLITAARRGDSDKVYAVADDVAALTLDAEHLFRLVMDFAIARSDWAAAVRYASLLAARDDRKGERRLQLSRLLVQIGAREAALASLDGGLSQNPDSLPLKREKFSLLIERGSEEEIDLCADQMLDSAAPSRLHEDLAQKLIDDRQYAPAYRLLRRAEERFGNEAGIARKLATVAYRLADHEEADRRWAELGEGGDPGLKRAATLFRARIANARGRRREALSYYESALAQDPANEEAARYSIRARARFGELEEARKLLDSYLGAAGETAAALYLDAFLRSEGGDEAGARASAKGLLIRFPDDAGLAVGVADLFSDRGDWGEALSVLKDAVLRNPGDFNLHTRLLRCLATLDAPPLEQLAVVESGRSLRSGDEGLLRAHGNLLSRLGDRWGAIAVAEEALQTHSRQMAFWRILIANRLALADNDGVEAAVQKARSVFGSESPADILAMAEILEVAERLTEALDYALRSVELGSGERPPLVIASRLLVATGDYRRALPLLRELQELDFRAGPGASMLARAARAVAYVDRGGHEGSEADTFPDAMLARIAEEAVPARWSEAAPVVFQVTGSLGAGGAERQVSLTVRGQLARAEADPEALRPHLAAYDLKGKGRDFFLPEVAATGADIVDLAESRAAGRVRDFAAARPDRREAIGLLSALPPEASAIALPLFCDIVERRPRVVHLWQDSTAIAGGVAAMLAGVPRIVIGTRSTRPVERQRVRPWLRGGFEALRHYPGTLFLNNSRNGGRDYEQWLGWPEGSFVTVNNGFEFPLIRARADPSEAASIRARLGLSEGSVLLGGVMRLSFEKRPELWLGAAIAAARSVPDLHAVLVGDGPMREELEAAVAASGVAERIHLVGRQIPVEPWMAAMDLLFLSSLTEGLPNVLVEAQALGIPVATMRVGGAPETVIEGKTAAVIDEGSPAEVAEKLLPLLTDAALRAEYGAAAALWTEQTFSDHSMLDQLDALYRDGLQDD